VIVDFDRLTVSGMAGDFLTIIGSVAVVGRKSLSPEYDAVIVLLPVPNLDVLKVAFPAGRTGSPDLGCERRTNPSLVNTGQYTTGDSIFSGRRPDQRARVAHIVLSEFGAEESRTDACRELRKAWLPLPHRPKAGPEEGVETIITYGFGTSMVDSVPCRRSFFLSVTSRMRPVA
jgi:hypothetical protein